jgi:phytoene dehydrogenase-like protein
MNGDASKVSQMLGKEEVAQESQDSRSLSGVVLLLGMRRKLSGVHHHNVFFSTDYPHEFRELFELRRFPADPTVYVNIPTVSDRSLAPPNGEALFIMANAPADAGRWDDDARAAARDAMLGRLRASGFPLNEADIATEMMITPEWMADRYDMPGGAIYGRHSHGWRNAFLRTPNKDPRIAGLYYVTGSGHPGGGTPIVLLAARIAADLVARYEKDPS